MINLLKKIFECKHTRTKEGFKQSKRFDKPIVIDYKECLDCGRMLRCKVSFLEEAVPVVPTVAMPPQQITLATDNKDVVTGTLNVALTVSLSMDLTENPGQNCKEAEPPAPVKEEVKVEPPKVPEIRDAEHVEESLEKETEEGPFTPQADTAPVPTGEIAEPSDVDEIDDGVVDDQSKDAMVEGMCFLKESKSSIAQRRRLLARRREKAMEALKKTGKAKIKVQKKNGIPFLDEPDRASREDEVQ